MITISLLCLVFVGAIPCFGADFKGKESQTTTSENTGSEDLPLAAHKIARNAFMEAIEKGDKEAGDRAFSKLHKGELLALRELWLPVREKDHKKIKTLLQQGADPNIKIRLTRNGIVCYVSCLCIALDNNDRPSVELLLQAKANLPDRFELCHAFSTYSKL